MMFGMRAGFLILILVSISASQAPQGKGAANSQGDPAAILADASGLYRKGSFDQAVARYNEVLRANPGSGEAYAGIIRCYLKQDKLAEADDALDKGRQAAPGSADFKVAEGELRFRHGEIEQAEKLFEEVISTEGGVAPGAGPPNARAYLGAARIAAASAMYAREQAMIRRAHELDASDADIRKIWMQMQAGAERVQSLEQYLAQPANDDEDGRRRLRQRLDLLKASQGGRGDCLPTSDVSTIKTTMLSISLGSGEATGRALDVEIEGKPFRLLLDTGASGIILGSKVAVQAGLKSEGDIRISGIGDRADVPSHIAYAKSVQIGEMQFKNCPVYIVDRAPKTSDGVIGTDVFAQFLIDLDFPSSTMQLSQLPPRPGFGARKPSLSLGAEETRMPAVKPGSDEDEDPDERFVPPEMHSYVKAYRFEHMLLVPTKINEGGSRLFLLDTGAFDNTITPGAGREVTKVHRAPRLDVRGINGEVKKVYVGDRVTLDFGHLRQTVPDIVALDMSRSSRQAGTEISGTLGMVMVNVLRVRLDYRDALADFQYVPKQPRR